MHLLDTGEQRLGLFSLSCNQFFPDKCTDFFLQCLIHIISPCLIA